MNSAKIFDEDGDINPFFILKHFWNLKLNMILVLFVSFLLGYFVANFALPKEYTAESILTPVESKQGATGNVGSQIGSMIGLNLSGAMGVNNAEIAMEIIRSKDFFKRITEKYDSLSSKLVAVNDYADGKEVYDPELFNISKNQWVQRPSFLTAWSKYYNKRIKFIYSWERGGFLTVKFTHFSPQIASEVLNIIIKEVNLVKRDRDVLLADSSLDYLLRRSGTITNAELKRATSDLMQNQLKIKMFAELSPYYLVEPLDSVYVPESPSAPNTTLVTFSVALMGLGLYFIFVVVKLIIAATRSRQ